MSRRSSPTYQQCSGCEAQAARAFEQRRRVRLGVRHGVARDDAAGVRQADLRDQRIGEARRLVGDDAPGHAGLLDAAQQWSTPSNSPLSTAMLSW